MILSELKSNGVIIWEGASPFNDRPIVAIITGWKRPSTNTKTGPMLQLWILSWGRKPHEAVKLGLDGSTCGNCKHGGAHLRTCYVRTEQGPLAVFRTWKAGKYPEVTPGDLAGLLRARKLPIRIGAYGDPGMLPFWLVKLIAESAPGHTGYTHQYQEDWFDERLLQYLMVSLDGAEGIPGTFSGRSFRVLTALEELRSHEVLCPATEEGGNKAQCFSCRLCAGLSKPAKSVALLAHGKGASRLTRELRVV